MSLTSLQTSSVVPEIRLPKAVAVCDPEVGVIGSVVKIDGRKSTDPDSSLLTYTWSFDSVPIGSKVIGEGFKVVDPDGSVVSFSPDVVGEYVIGLTVSNGVFTSDKSQAVSSIRSILVPHARGIVPDGKWIWSYIRDVWQGVEGKELFESLWSALIQIAGAELLKLYQVDFNKSIRDIQDFFQRRWLSYEPEREILVNGPDFYFGSHYAGTDATTLNLGLNGSVIILGSNDLVLVEGSILQNVGGNTLRLLSSSDPANNRSYSLSGLNTNKNGYQIARNDGVSSPIADRVDTNVAFLFETGATLWSVNGARGKPYAQLMSEYGSPLDYLLPLFMGNGSAGILNVQAGDVIHYKAGPNKGFYRILSKTGSFVTVEKAAPSFSNATTSATYTADVYRPVRFSIDQPDALLTDTIGIPLNSASDVSVVAPGRVVLIGGQCYTILRSSVDSRQRVPTVIITVDRPLLQSGLTNQSWRTPPTLISTTQDFEAEGVSPGDLIVFDVVMDGEKVCSLPCQVIGVDRGRLGFVFSNETVVPGTVPSIPSSFFTKLANDLGIDGVKLNADGTVSFSGDAATYIDTINSGLFKRKYWNQRLTPDSDIQVNPTFRIKPRIIVRNSLIPIDETVRSIPVLQNFIVPARVQERDGKFFQQKNGKEYEVPAPPITLRENIDYIVDGQFAFKGQMTFQTGSDVFEVDDGDFIDRGIRPGDEIVIVEPITLARTYYVQAVLSPTRLKLTRAIPTYPPTGFVTAKVRIKRKRSGNFIRFTPGTFTAKEPAPSRFWAEVTFFDNNENIENNFGILVGLTREDIEAVSENINYRQAVSGLMYAFLKGSALEKVRLGAQILLGLPFSEHRGIIRSIETDYRLGIDGSPILGRLLIEDVSNVGEALGTLRVYTYPIDPASDLAGLDINPSTGLEYKVGDIVERFAALSRGVEVSDYVSNPLPSTNFSLTRLLQQFHSIRVRVNDNLFTLDEIGLVSGFLKKITPSYVAFFISSVSDFADEVVIRDSTFFRIGVGSGDFVDNVSLAMPPSMNYSSRSPSAVPQIVWDEGVFWIRRSGSTLSTTDGSGVLTIPNGGVLNPRTGEDFEGPLTRAGDLVTIPNGINSGTYTVASATDTTITLSDAPAFGFETSSNARFFIKRKMTSLIHSGVSGAFVSGNPIVVLQGGLRSNGVAVGDFLINTVTGDRYSILEVIQNISTWDRVRVSPTPTATSTVAWSVYRASLIERPFPVSGTLSVTSSGSNTLTAVDPLIKAIGEIGDELQVQNTALTRVTLISPIHGYTQPALAAGSYAVKLLKKNPSGLTWDVLGRTNPSDFSDSQLRETQALATCTSGSNLVSLSMQRLVAPASGPSAVSPTTLGVLPGDLLILGGTNGTVDVGYGAGVYPIASLPGGSDVRLVVSLGTSESVSWRISRRR